MEAPSAGLLTLRWLALPEPIAQIFAADDGALLALSRIGRLWRVDGASGAWAAVGEGLDAAGPVATGSGRIAARRSDGSLWVRENGRVQTGADVVLAPHAGLLILPFAVVGVALGRDGHRVVRIEPSTNSVWRVADRSNEAVLPDARPVRAALDGEGDGGHVVVLAGPDDQRYRHGVLGDAIESTRLLYLERHGLTVLREWRVPAPHVIEDIAPRVVTGGGRDALLTVQSGPHGAQLVLVGADRADPGGLAILARGEPLGAPSRWMAPTTDGTHWLAVHTPHIGGVLHRYVRDGDRLVAERIAAGYSNHHIGSRLLDSGSWLGGRLLLPDPTGRRLALLDVAHGARVIAEATLPDAVAATVAWTGGRHAVLLADGRAGTVAAAG